MTSGSATLKNFSNWAVGGLKSKKRQRSGSGGSKKSFVLKKRSNNREQRQGEWVVQQNNLVQAVEKTTVPDYKGMRSIQSTSKMWAPGWKVSTSCQVARHLAWQDDCDTTKQDLKTLKLGTDYLIALYTAAHQLVG